MAEQRFKVLWTEAAAGDLEQLVSFIAIESPAAARKVLAGIEQKGAALKTFPRRGRVVPELARLGLRAWRELVAKPYRVIYRISDSTVFVLAVLDGRRDLEDLLLQRLVR